MLLLNSYIYYIPVGVLVSHPSSRDVHIHNFSLTFHGAELLSDTKLELNNGRRYGLVGLNGSGMLVYSIPFAMLLIKQFLCCEFLLGVGGDVVSS